MGFVGQLPLLQPSYWAAQRSLATTTARSPLGQREHICPRSSELLGVLALLVDHWISTGFQARASPPPICTNRSLHMPACLHRYIYGRAIGLEAVTCVSLTLKKLSLGGRGTICIAVPGSASGRFMSDGAGLLCPAAGLLCAYPGNAAIVGEAKDL